jgi:hypothetical protein
MRQLLWKEWHEQSWKLAFGCIVLASLVLIGLQARLVADETMMMWVCFLGVTLLPVLSSSGLIPAEREAGSFESLMAMPIAPWRILLAKTLMGLMMCAGPMLAAFAVSWALAGGREMHSWDIFDLYGRSALVMVLLFFWMMAFTARLPSEARAGLVAVGVFICWMLGTAGLGAPELPRWLVAISPLVFLQSWFWFSSGAYPWLLAPLVQVVTVGLLWGATLLLFVRSNVRES